MANHKERKTVVSGTDFITCSKRQRIICDLHNKDVDIAEANERGGLAISQAATATGEAAKANERASKAELALGVAQKEAAKANEKAAEANKATEQERSERLKLEALIAPRRINAENIETVGTALKQLGKHRVTIESYALDSEGSILAKQIRQCLEIGEMDIDSKISSRLPLGDFALGVEILSLNPELANKFAAAICIPEKLTCIIPAVVYAPRAKDAPPNGGFMPTDADVYILVGAKP